MPRSWRRAAPPLAAAAAALRRRAGLACFVTVAAITGCSHRAAVGPAARVPSFHDEQQKILACLDLQDHIVDLYATEYVSHENLTLSSTERLAFRDGWAEELAKRGTFDRFEQSCFYSLTPNRYECGMHSQTTGGLAACMKLSQR